jgi:hypothetical protein
MHRDLKPKRWSYLCASTCQLIHVQLPVLANQVIAGLEGTPYHLSTFNVWMKAGRTKLHNQSCLPVQTSKKLSKCIQGFADIYTEDKQLPKLGVCMCRLQVMCTSLGKFCPCIPLHGRWLGSHPCCSALLVTLEWAPW